MKKILTACLILFFAGWAGISTVNAQTQLYGLTSTGGANNFGTIFHFSPATDAFTLDKSLPFLYPGASPGLTDLTDGGNGKFYGMTNLGGEYNTGVIFEWDPMSNIYEKKIDLSEATGNNPNGSLTLFGGNFYGMTFSGGAYNAGVIFEWDPATNIYTKKIDLNTTIGCDPTGSLTLYGSKLYGMASNGGGNGQGAIFEWDPATNIYIKKIDMIVTQGCSPAGSLTLSGGKFYGMTKNGGTNNSSCGVIFEWDPATNTYTKKIDLSYANGSNPLGSLTESGGKFYGMTFSGGASNTGVIFVWDPTTNVYTKKIDFTSWSGKGYWPYGSLRLLNGKFYGMTLYGGNNEQGVIFEWDPGTNIYNLKFSFNSNAGSLPMGSLTLGNGKFYGMASGGGTNDSGVIFEWDPVSNVYIRKISLNISNGENPNGSLSLYADKFYGMTSLGGTNGVGVIFEWDPVSFTYTKKIDFKYENGTSPDGRSPSGSLALYGNKFYATASGGANEAGVIFEWDPVANTYLKKKDFSSALGSSPVGSLTLSGSKFYGLAQMGGNNEVGAIFEWDPATNIYVKKIDFNGPDGGYPSGSLTLFGGKFYGITSGGGSNEMGVIYEWDPATNSYTKKFDFNGSEGSYPEGSLALCGDKFYGMAGSGGANGAGVIFEWDPGTNLFIKKIDLEVTVGLNPKGPLTLSGGIFYGLTFGGGANGSGVLFSWDPLTNTFIKKVDFIGSNGSSPMYTALLAYGQPCTNPVSGGTIAEDQSGAGSFDPAALIGTVAPACYSGTLEYKWQKSLVNGSSGFIDIGSSNSEGYDPELCTQTTWYKRLARVACMSDWSGAAESNILTMTVTNPVPENLTIENTTLHSEESECYNAVKSIIVAGLIVETGGNATLVAGESIRYMPGTKVLEGGIMHGYITTTSDYCEIPNPLVAVGFTGEKEIPSNSSEPWFKLYPNPTQGIFTIELSGNEIPETVQVDIYGTFGEKIVQQVMCHEKRRSFLLKTAPAGIYLVRVSTATGSVTRKIVKM